MCWVSACPAAALSRAEGQTAGGGRIDRKGVAFSLLLLAASLASAQDAIGERKVGLCPKCAPTRGVLLLEGEAQDAGCSPGAPQ